MESNTFQKKKNAPRIHTWANTMEYRIQSNAKNVSTTTTSYDMLCGRYAYYSLWKRPPKIKIQSPSYNLQGTCQVKPSHDKTEILYRSWILISEEKLSFEIGSTSITSKTVIKYLGIMIDNNLSFLHHFKNIWNIKHAQHYTCLKEYDRMNMDMTTNVVKLWSMVLSEIYGNMDPQYLHTH